MKIVVLAGGTSTERDVSLSSGNKIYRALKNRGHQAVLIDVYLGYESEEPVTRKSSLRIQTGRRIFRLFLQTPLTFPVSAN